MSRRMVGWAAAAALVVLAGARQPRAQEPAGAGEARPPVTISADEAEYHGAEDRVIFIGKVVAVQGDATITADRLEVVLAPAEGDGEGEASAGGMLAAADRETSIVSMLATGSVSFRQVDPGSGVERFATGERGEYDARERVVTISGGSPRAWEGKNVMNCERMTFALEERNMKCFGKVNMTVYPAEGSGGGAPGAPERGAAPR